jgi:hypothetical protein
MARLDQVHPAMRAALLAMECPTFDTQPWVAGPALSQQRASDLSRRQELYVALACCGLWVPCLLG